MRKRIQKIIGMMLVMFASCFCGLTGCKDKYADMKLTLSESEIVLSLDKDDEGVFVNNTAEFSATVSGIDKEEISSDVFFEVSTPDVIGIEKTSANSLGVSYFTLTANNISTEPVVLTVRTKEGNKTASLTVVVKKSLQKMETNTAYSPYVVVGNEGINLNTTSAVIFTPEDTSEKQVEYEIANSNGHTATITKNGHLVVEKKNGAQPIIVRIKSTQANVDSIEVPVKVVDPIKLEDVKLSVDGNEILDSYTWSVMDLDNSDLELNLNLENTLEECVVSTQTEMLMQPTNQKILAVEYDSQKIITTGSKLLLHTQGTTGTNTLKLVIKLKDYDYSITKEIKFTVAKLPNQILVNNENLTNKSKAYDIYDKYQNNLGKNFTIEIGDEGASIKQFKLFVAEDQRSQINVVLENGVPAMLDNSIAYKTGTVLYIKADENYIEGNNPTLLLTSAGSDEVYLQSIITFNLRTAATSLNIEAFGENQNMLYVEYGKEITLSYSADSPKAYVRDLIVEGYDNSVIEVKVDETINTKPIITIKGLKVNGGVNYAPTSFKVKLPNGFESETINVYVFVGSNSNNIKLKAPSMTDSQYGKYIANIENDIYGDLSHVVLAKGGIVKFSPVVLGENGDATIYSQTFELVNENDRNFVSINDEGFISTRQVKETDEGKIRIKATIKALQSVENDGIYKGNAEILEKTFEFDVSIFVQMTGISLDKQYASIYYSNGLWYENSSLVELNKTSLQLSVYPSNASADEISWQISDEEAVSVEQSQDGKTLKIKAQDGNVQKNISISVFVTQKNKTYTKTCYLSISPVVLPKAIIVDGVKYGNMDNVEANKLTLLSEGYYQVRGNTRQIKEILIDSRDLSQNSFIDIVSHIKNNDATNKYLAYELYDNEYDICSITKDGRLTFKTNADSLIAGTAIVRIIAQGSKTDKSADAKVVDYVAVKVLNGESIDSAFVIRSEKDFWRMLRDEKISEHYYVIANDIYLTKSLKQADSEEELKYNGLTPRYLSSANGERFAVRNLIIDKAIALLNYENEIVGDALSLFTEHSSSYLQNLDLYVSIDDSSISYKTKNVYVSPFVAINNGTIENISVKVENINLSKLASQENLEEFYFGGMVAYNEGNIISTNKNFVDNDNSLINFVGEVDLTELTASNFASDAIIGIGGVVGCNMNLIGGIVVDNSVIKTALSNIGGLVGINYAVVENNLVNCEVYGLNNIGGLVGQTINTDYYNKVLNNIVEIYETDRIYSALQTNETYKLISGTENVGGLIGYVYDLDKTVYEAEGETYTVYYNASEIKYNYVKTYNQKIMIAGEINVGGLIGNANGINTDNEQKTTQTLIDTNFAYTYLEGTENVGGLVGKITNALVQNVYARGKVNGSDTSSLFGQDSDVDLTSYYVENDKHNNFVDTPWTVNENYNDGYSILTYVENENTYLMEKLTPTEIVVIEDIDEKRVIKHTENSYDISAWFTNVDISELILSSSDKNIFAIENQKLVFKDYGKAILTACSKYDRTISASVEVIFIHNVDELQLNNADEINGKNYLYDNDKIDENKDNVLRILKNTSATVYPFVLNNSEKIEDIENLFISFENGGLSEIKINGLSNICGTKQVEYYDEEQLTTVTVDENVYTKFALNEIVISALEKFSQEISVMLYEKVGDEYIPLFDENKYFNINVYEGIKSISLDKNEVDLTTMNSVDFVLTIVADADNLSFDFVDKDDENKSHIDTNENEKEDYELTISKSEQKNSDNGLYTYTVRYTLAVKDKFFTLESSNENLLRESFNTTLTLKVLDGQTELGTQSLEVNVNPQELLKIDVLHFPNGMEDRESKLFEANELPANTLTPGEFGLLMIDIYPTYAYFDEIEVSYTTSSSYTMSFVQVAKTTAINNSVKFLDIKPSALIESQKVVLARTSNAELNANGVMDTKSFDGKYYVKTLVPTKTPAGMVFTLIVKATTYGRNGEKDTYLYSKQLVLSTLPRPTVDLSTDSKDYQKQVENEQTYYVIARGTSQQVFAETENYSKNAEFTYICKSHNGNLLTEQLNSLKQTFVNEKGNDYIDIADKLFIEPSLSTNGNSATLYVPTMVPAGTKIIITATVRKFINGVEVVSTSNIEFRVVDYVIKGLETNYELNTINMREGTDKEVSLRLIVDKVSDNNDETESFDKVISDYTKLNNTYKKINGENNNEYIKTIEKYSNAKNTLLSAIADINQRVQAKNTEISTIGDNSSYWYVKYTEDKVEKIDNITSEFNKTSGDITDDLYYVHLSKNSNKKLNINAVNSKSTVIKCLSAEFYYKYDFDNSGMKILVPENDNEKDKFNFVNVDYDDINIYITTSATIDNPTPVYTVSKLLSLGEEDYILMNDLYLTTKNDYFAEKYEETYNDSENVKSNVINSTGNYYYYDENSRFTSITPQFKSLDGNGKTIYINSFAFNTKTSSFGLFDIIPENCIVKNLNVVFISQNNKYVITGENISTATFGLLAGTNNGIITNCNVSFKLLKSGIETFNLSISNDVNTISGLFVGENNGYITNSKVNGTNLTPEEIKIFNFEANGQVAGFVGKNNGKISTSYAFNTGVKNTSQELQGTLTAGFVAENTSNGRIMECFAEGYVNIEKQEGKDVKEEDKYNSENMNNIVVSKGNIGGFVYQNSGYIKDCYSNLPLETPSRVSGFVFINSGSNAIIRECYSISKSVNQKDSTAFSFFTGTDTKSIVNNLNGAQIINCYYSSAIVSDENETDKRFKEPAEYVGDLTKENVFHGFDTTAGAEIWNIGGVRPKLVQTEAETSSIRTISKIEFLDGVPVNYIYNTQTNGDAGSEKNPILVYDAKSFLQAFNGGELKYKPNGEKYLYNSGYIRFITDINLSEVSGTDELKKLQNVIFAGNLDGNGFELQNVRILGDENSTAESFGLFEQIGYFENNSDEKISKSGVVKNLIIKILEVTKTKSQCVGVLAGKITQESTICQITIDGEGVVVEGQNIVGALAGFVDKGSILSSITSNVSVNAAYAKNKNLKAYAESEKNVIKYAKTKNVDFSKISYAGGIVGILDTGKTDEEIKELVDNYNSGDKENYRQKLYQEYCVASNLSVYGSVDIQGEIVGGIAGYNGIRSKIYDSKFEISTTNNSQSIEGKFASGGIVGENYGALNAVRIEVNDLIVEDIDSKFNNDTPNTIFESEKTNPMYVGGLVGLMPRGSLTDSFSKANVIHKNAKYIGGIAGKIGGGEDIITIDSDETLLIEFLPEVYGTKLTSVYTTGNVFTNPNYVYTIPDPNDNSKTKILPNGETDLTNGTIKSDITATPQNHIGGLYGFVTFNFYGTNNEYLATDILSSVVSANNWRLDIDGYNNILRTINGTDNDSTTINVPDDEIRKDELDVEIKKDNTTTYVKYKPTVGYFAGSLNSNKTIETTDDNIVKYIEYNRLYLNNFIGELGTKDDDKAIKIIKQTADDMILNETDTKFELPDSDGVSEQYINLKVNSRKELFRNEVKNGVFYQPCYKYFTDRVWDRYYYIYPKLIFRVPNTVKEIKNEEELFEIADTSSSYEEYVICKDIYLTRNWNPVKGFKAVLRTANEKVYTIYNININLSSKETKDISNVGFFASGENVQVKNINFVYGTHFIPDIKSYDNNEIYYKEDKIYYDDNTSNLSEDEEPSKFTFENLNGNNNLLTKWDTTNGNFPFCDGKMLGKTYQSLKVNEQNEEIQALGGIQVDSSDIKNSNINISALFGEVKNLKVENVNLYFANNSNIEVKFAESVKDIKFGIVAADCSIKNDYPKLNNITIASIDNGKITYENKYELKTCEKSDNENDTSNPNLNIEFVFNSTDGTTIENIYFGGMIGCVIKNGAGNFDIQQMASNTSINLIQTKNLIQTNSIKKSNDNSCVMLGGMIGSLEDTGASIKNCSILNGSIIFDTNDFLNVYAGGLISKASQLKTFENVNVNDFDFELNNNAYSDSGYFYFGGMIGHASEVDYVINKGCEINTSLSSQQINANAVYLGGMAGYAQSCNVNNKNNNIIEVETNINVSNIKADKVYSGGSFGQVKDINCKNIATKGDIVIGSFTQQGTNFAGIEAGGFVGEICDVENNIDEYNHTFENCVTSVNIELPDNTKGNSGGFVGNLNGRNNNGNSSFIINSASFGNLTANGFNGNIGGFVGTKSGSTGISAYSFATIFTNNTNMNVGGFVGATTNTNSSDWHYVYAYAGVPHNGKGISSNLDNLKNKLNETLGKLCKEIGLTDSGGKLSPIEIKSTDEIDKLAENTVYCLPEMKANGTIASPTLSNIETSKYSILINNSNDSNYITNNSNNPTFSSVAKQSLISGIIVEIDNQNITSNYAGFVNENNGTIFNSAIKGIAKINSDNISFAGFVSTNNGIISNCSTSLQIDLNNKQTETAGFVLNNSGVVQNSFTSGQIDNASNSIVYGFGYGLASGIFKNNYSSIVCFDASVSSYGFGKINESINSVNNEAYINQYDSVAFYTENADETHSFGKQKTSYFMDKGVYAYGEFVSKVGKNNYSWTQSDDCNYSYPVLKDYNLSNGDTNKNFVKDSGNGNRNKPYLIPHYGKFDWIRTKLGEDKSLYFKQINDFDFDIIRNDSVSELTAKIIRAGIEANGFAPVKEQKVNIYYDGDNHKIDKLAFKKDEITNQIDLYALFEKVYEIKNLYLDNVECNIDLLDSDITRVGAFAGTANTISNCGVYYEDGLITTLKDNSYFGGLVGYVESNGKIQNSFVKMQNANIETRYIGGLAGNQVSGIIDNCFANIEITTKDARCVGGLVGNTTSAKFTNSFAAGRIYHSAQSISSNTCIGGLCGNGGSFDASDYSIVSCYEVVSQGRNTSTLKVNPISNATVSNTAKYDENISLCTGSGTNIDIPTSWLKSSGQANTLSGSWQYSSNCYPVQSYYLNNTNSTVKDFAKKCLDYDQTGNYICPFINKSDDLSGIGSAKSILLNQNIKLESSLSSDENHKLFINGLGHKITGSASNIALNAKNIIISNVKVDYDSTISSDSSSISLNNSKIGTGTIYFQTSDSEQGTVTVSDSNKIKAATENQKYKIYVVNDLKKYLISRTDTTDYTYSNYIKNDSNFQVSCGLGSNKLTVKGIFEEYKYVNTVFWTDWYNWDWASSSSTVTVTAKAKDGYSFTGWKWDSSQKTFEAQFKKNGEEPDDNQKLEKSCLYNVEFNITTNNRSALLSTQIISTKLAKVKVNMNDGESYETPNIYGGILAKKVISSVFNDVKLYIKETPSNSESKYVMNYSNASLFVGEAEKSYFNNCDVHNDNKGLNIKFNDVENFGALVGKAENSTFENIYGSIASNESHGFGNFITTINITTANKTTKIGGLAGYMSGCEMKDGWIGWTNGGDYLKLNVSSDNTATKYVGAVVGEIASSTVSNLNVYNSVSVNNTAKANIYIGGVFGKVDKTTYDNCSKVTRYSGQVEGYTEPIKSAPTNNNSDVNKVFKEENGNIWVNKKQGWDWFKGDPYEYSGNHIVERVYITSSGDWNISDSDYGATRDPSNGKYYFKISLSDYTSIRAYVGGIAGYGPKNSSNSSIINKGVTINCHQIDVYYLTVTARKDGWGWAYYNGASETKSYTTGDVKDNYIAKTY